MKLILLVIMELIILRVIKLQANDLVHAYLHPSSLFTPYSHSSRPVHSNGHSPLYTCIGKKLKRCVDNYETMSLHMKHRCILLSFVNCFGHASLDDPIYSVVQEWFNTCNQIEEENLQIICFMNSFIKMHA